MKRTVGFIIKALSRVDGLEARSLNTNKRERATTEEMAKDSSGLDKDQIEELNVLIKERKYFEAASLNVTMALREEMIALMIQKGAIQTRKNFKLGNLYLNDFHYNHQKYRIISGEEIIIRSLNSLPFS